LVGSTLKIGHFVYDDALGNNAGLQTVKQLKLYLVSKLRHDSVLYFPYTGEYSGKGKPKKYGDKPGQSGLNKYKNQHIRKYSILMTK